jgi:hypothetical protein
MTDTFHDEAARAHDRYLATVSAAREDDARVNVQRAAAGLPSITSVVLTPEQSSAPRAGSLDLADVLPPEPWYDIDPSLIDVRVDPARWTAWSPSSLFTLAPGETEWRRWHRGPNGPKARKRRADRRRSDRKRRAVRKATGRRS